MKGPYSCFLTLEDMKDVAKLDTEYAMLRDNLIKGTPSVCKLITNKQDLNELSLYDDVIILKNNKILVPKSLRQQVLELSHLAHPAFDRNFRHFTRFFYWPNMTNDIKIHTKNCPQCIEYANKQPQIGRAHV